MLNKVQAANNRASNSNIAYHDRIGLTKKCACQINLKVAQLGDLCQVVDGGSLGAPILEFSQRHQSKSGLEGA